MAEESKSTQKVSKADAPAGKVAAGVNPANAQDAEENPDPATLLSVPPPPNRISDDERQEARDKAYQDTFGHLEGDEEKQARAYIEAQWEAEDKENERLNRGYYSE